MTRDITLDRIQADPEQPRKYFDPESLAELADSIAEHGLAVPILLRPAGDDYIIVHGERRFRAVQSLGWESIPAEVRDVTPEQARWLALIENIQREDLSPIEEADEYQRILGTGITQTDLSKRIGKSQSYIAHKLRLTSMPDILQRLIRYKMITEGHARQLLRLEGIYHGADYDSSWILKAHEDIMPISEGQTLMVLTQPLEHLPGFVYLEKYVEENREHVIEMFDDLARHYVEWMLEVGPIIPSWVRAAFHLGCYAYHYSMSVRTLEKSVDLFRDILYSGIMFSEGWPGPKEGMRGYERYGHEWTGAHEDVWSARVSLDRNPELVDVAVHWWAENDKYFLPTRMQPWSPIYDDLPKEKYSNLFSLVNRKSRTWELLVEKFG